MTRLKGLLGLLLILGLVVGMPILLLTVGGLPIPDQAPGLQSIRDTLTAPDDGTLFLGALIVIGWVTWAVLAAAILLEIIARIRGVRVPNVRAMSLPQGAARGLVGAAAGLFGAAAPIAAHAAPAPPPAAVSTQTAGASVTTTAPTTTSGTDTATKTAAHSTAPAADQELVKHRVGSGDTLWSLAEEYLGSGERYGEIVDANPDRFAAGDGDFLREGWTLTIPVPAPTPKTDHQSSYVVRSGDTLWDIAGSKLGDPTRYNQITSAQLTNPDHIEVGWTVQIPGPVSKADPAPETRHVPQTPKAAGPKADTQPQADAAPKGDQGGPKAAQGIGKPKAPPSVAAPSSSADQQAPAAPATKSQQKSADGPAATTPLDAAAEDGFPVRTAAGVGSILGAGVIALLYRRRRIQQRHRKPGQRLPKPTPQAESTEVELRQVADPLSVAQVDTALRQLAADCASAHQPLPAVRAARLTRTAFELYLEDDPGHDLPAPWEQAHDATTIWSLTRPASEDTTNTADNVPAPYPSLVTIGHDLDDGHVLLNLEHLGALGLHAHDPAAHDDTREVLAALAVELATSEWADDLQVTLAGAFPELEDALGTGRIRYVPSVDRVLHDLTVRADQDRAALTGSDLTLEAARAAGELPDTWTPEIVLIAGPVTTSQQDKLTAVLHDLPRVAVAAVTSDPTVGEWGLTLPGPDAEDDLAVLQPVDLQIRPQRIPAEEYGRILVTLAMSDENMLEDATEQPPTDPTLEDLEHVPTADAADNVGASQLISDLDDALQSDVDDQPAADVDDQQPVLEDQADLDDPQEADEEQQPGPGEEPEEAADEEQLADEDHARSADHEEEHPWVPFAALQAETADPPHDPASAASPEGQEDDSTAVAAAGVHPLPGPTPRILLLGPPEIVDAQGPAPESSRTSKLTELAAYLVTHQGATHVAIDDAIWPNRTKTDNTKTRNPATSKLRRWLGKNAAGDEFLSRNPSAGYGFREEVTSDIAQWEQLLDAGPFKASTEALEDALKLVRGRPFAGVGPRKYAWAERLMQDMISAIVDAACELGRRRLMEGRWQAAEAALAIGTEVDESQERVWRLRILAAHEAGNTAEEEQAVDRLMFLADAGGWDLEDETTQLLDELKNPAARLARFITEGAR